HRALLSFPTRRSSDLTVSRVLNEHPNVRQEVRERVWEVIRRTGYHPNAAARTLASQRSWVIGLVLPRSVSSFFTDPYFPHLTQGDRKSTRLNSSHVKI